MQFVNTTGNTIKLNDTNKVIPFLDENSQEINTDDVKRSKMFQMLCLSKKFVITFATDDRIEQNLLRMQNGQVPVPEERIEVIVRGHFYSNSGYGKANRNLVYALGRAGIRVGIETASESNSPLNQMELERIARFRRELPNAICIDSVIPSFNSKTDHKYRILNTTVEAASVPKQFVDACNGYDEVWVASDFCREVFQKYGVKKQINIIPNAVEMKLYNEEATPHVFSKQLKKFVFISVMSWSYRKGYEPLIKAYLKEFSKDDNVSLLIISPYANFNDECENYIKNAVEKYGENHAQIGRIGRQIPEHEMPGIYKACNCFVLTSLGEGFGLPYVEASLCGLPVIGTNHSGQRMFLNKDNSYLIDIDKLSIMPIGKTDIHYWDGQLFPEMKSEKVINDIRKQMRYVYENYEIAKGKNKLLQKNLIDYSLENVGQKAVERLQIIWKMLYSS